MPRPIARFIAAVIVVVAWYTAAGVVAYLGKMSYVDSQLALLTGVVLLREIREALK